MALETLEAVITLLGVKSNLITVEILVLLWGVENIDEIEEIEGDAVLLMLMTPVGNTALPSNVISTLDRRLLIKEVDWPTDELPEILKGLYCLACNKRKLVSVLTVDCEVVDSILISVPCMTNAVELNRTFEDV